MRKRDFTAVTGIFVILTAFLFVFAGRVLYVTNDYWKARRLNGDIETYITEQQLNGSVLVAKDGKILYSEGFGYSDLGRTEENTRDTSFKLASVTKQITASAVILLEKEGKLSVDDPLGKYFPECSYGERVTVHDLLSMRSGIPDCNGNEDFEAALGERFMYEGTGLEELVQEILNQTLLYEPGTESNYSNSNYILLGRIIEQVTGEPYEAYIADTFFRPLGMRNAGFMWLSGSADALDASGEEDGLEFNGSLAYAAGGLCASAVDLYKWQNALYDGKLGYDIRELMEGDYGYDYGLNYGDGVYWHMGSLHICTSYILYDDRNDLQVIVLSNTKSVNAADVAEGLYEIVKNDLGIGR